MINELQQELWDKIQKFEIDLPESKFKFSDRLSKENDWTKEYTLRVVEEYKKFMFLAVVAGHPVTPSEEIDQAWHLHLLYTQSYWKEFREILGIDINHGPTKGSKEEGDKFIDWYEKTKESYRQLFSKEPPLDVWPRSYYRFYPRNFKRIDVDEYYMIPKDLWIGKLIEWFKAL